MRIMEKTEAKFVHWNKNKSLNQVGNFLTCSLYLKKPIELVFVIDYIDID